MAEKTLHEQLISLVHLVATSSCPRDTDGDGDCGRQYCPICGATGAVQTARKIRESLGQSRVGTTVEKPWGRYSVLWEGPGALLKRLMIRKDQAISYQYHLKRYEIWTVVQGVGRYVIDGTTRWIGENETITIGTERRHSIECVSDRDLVIYELQVGECDEDDIVRISDKYGRV